MQVTTYEGVIENGQIRLKSGISLPDKATVYVVVPNSEPQKTVRIYSPRLVNPSQAIEFQKEVIEEPEDADI